ncbi:MAG: ATP-binding protein [Ignavibacteria bacterium]
MQALPNARIAAMNRRQIAFDYAMLALLAGILAFGGWLVERINDESYDAELRARVQHDLVLVRDRLEGNLNGDLQLVRGLIAVIALNPDLDQKQFERALRPIFEGHSQLRNVGAAPGMVIRLMYPLRGNEKAIGLDYRKLPAQSQAAEKARDTRQIVLAGPLQLVQGGTGVVARLPVFLSGDAAGERFWGLVSAVIDADRLFESSGLREPKLQIEIALRGTDGRGAEGEVFLGRPQVFDDRPVVSDIPLPQGSWQMAAVPRGGWPRHAENVWALRFGFALLGLVIVGTLLSVVRALRKVSRAQEDAEAANSAKTRFLAVMSHEIRTPMNGILGMAQLLLSERLNEAERFEYARVILNSGHTLLTLLNDILDLSKVEAGRLELESLAFDPAQLIEEVKTLFAEQARVKGLALEAVWRGTSQPAFRGDPIRLRQMLSNLVSNAIRFTSKGYVFIEGRDVHIADGSTMLEFSITDSGIGVSEDKQPLLFNPFSQVDASTTRKYGGTGLGLSIVRHLAKLMGGDVGFRSQEGKGSRFWFTVRAEMVTGSEERRQLERERRPHAAPGLPPAPAGHVLVVEDNRTNRKVIEAFLGKLGMRFESVENGAEAVKTITSGAVPALVLMDCQMPVMDGFEATAVIRKWEEDVGRPRLPIVALTAGAFAEDRDYCLSMGMDDFIAKPLKLDILSETLAKWIGERAAEGNAEPKSAAC